MLSFRYGSFLKVVHNFCLTRERLFRHIFECERLKYISWLKMCLETVFCLLKHTIGELHSGVVCQHHHPMVETISLEDPSDLQMLKAEAPYNFR